MVLKQTVVVEGKDDESAVLAAVSANVICTHGYGINDDILALIESAYRKTGIVIFTDPDHAGRKIRERLSALYPEALHAYLTENQAERDGDIGVENAKPEDIIKALKAGGATFDGGKGFPAEKKTPGLTVSERDLFSLGLAGGTGSSEKRAAVGAIIGIGSANSKTFLKRLNYLGIGLEELKNAIKEAAL